MQRGSGQENNETHVTDLGVITSLSLSLRRDTQTRGGYQRRAHIVCARRRVRGKQTFVQIKHRRESHGDEQKVNATHVVVLLGQQQDLNALHVGAAVQQVDSLVQVILTAQGNGQLRGERGESNMRRLYAPL